MPEPVNIKPVPVNINIEDLVESRAYAGPCPENPADRIIFLRVVGLTVISIASPDKRRHFKKTDLHRVGQFTI